MSKLLKIILLLFISTSIYSQTRVDTIRTNLEQLALSYPLLNETVSVSVSDVSIQEFIRGVAKTSKVNINVSPELNISVINNFSDVRVLDMLVFLAKEYELNIDITGNIVSISKLKKVLPPPPKIIPKEPKVSYYNQDSLISLDLQNDTLFKVTKSISEKTGQNIILAPGIENKLITIFIKETPVKQAMEMLALSNNLTFNDTKKEYFILESNTTKPQENLSASNNNKKENRKNTPSDKTANSNFEFSVIDKNDISITAESVPIIDILKQVSDLLGINYFFISELSGEANLKIYHVSYEALIKHLFDGTENSYSVQKGIYLFGEKKTEAIQQTRVHQLQYRTVEKVIAVMPENLKKGVTLYEFLDLNSLIITAPEAKINEIEMFIREIDKVVPVVLIEVMIVNVSNSYTQTIGLNAGLDGTKVPDKTTGQFAGGVDLNLSTQTINNLINSFNGFGWFNIGKVTPEFYLSIKALEDQGVIKLKSTPMLSTLNGSEASLKIGEKQYYYEETQNTIGTQNPQNIKTGTWKPVNADLDIKIKPVVSGDEQITLEIDVSQSDFTGKIANDAPPGSVDRSFKSLIRVKNEEMVLLGGLENKKNSTTSSGLPFLSRIPVIKWIFGTSSKVNSFSKLTIFIKPTVIY